MDVRHARPAPAQRTSGKGERLDIASHVEGTGGAGPALVEHHLRGIQADQRPAQVGGVPSCATSDVEADDTVARQGGKPRRVAFPDWSGMGPGPQEAPFLVDGHGLAVHGPRC